MSRKELKGRKRVRKGMDGWKAKRRTQDLELGLLLVNIQSLLNGMYRCSLVKIGSS